jgi:hypothetical protein
LIGYALSFYQVGRRISAKEDARLGGRASCLWQTIAGDQNGISSSMSLRPPPLAPAIAGFLAGAALCAPKSSEDS